MRNMNSQEESSPWINRVVGLLSFLPWLSTYDIDKWADEMMLPDFR